jgi:cleavage and polyadenylation specificity factor subunit 2
MITLTPLAGSSSSLSPTTTSPACYLLQLDDVRILLDMGGYDPRDAADRGVEYEMKIRE